MKKILGLMLLTPLIAIATDHGSSPLQNKVQAQQASEHGGQAMETKQQASEHGGQAMETKKQASEHGGQPLKKKASEHAGVPVE